MRGTQVEGDQHLVAETNDDATECKYWASKTGYFTDDFVKHFVKTSKVTRKQPLISRGYSTRVYAVRSLLHQFLEAGGKQVISFGAGFDTNYFVLKNLGNTSFQNFYELDFPHVIHKKILTIQKNSHLKDLIPNFSVQGMDSAYGDDYHLIGCDLRKLADLEAKLVAHKLDPKLPTLFLSECVLIYVNTSDSAALIKWTTTLFSESMFVIYEQINPDDAFGKMMERGVPLTSIKTYPDLKSQKKRMEDLGYTRVEAMTMLDVGRKILTREETQTIAHAEIFDEFEEWNMIQSHYCMVLATIGDSLQGVTMDLSHDRH